MQHPRIAQNSKTCQASPRLAKISLILGFSLLVLLPMDAAQARIVAKGEKIIQSDQRLIMYPGEVKTIKVGFKNTSSNIIWRRDSKNYASLYTVGPRYRKSPFAYKTWMAKNHVAKINSKQVKFGEVGYVEFSIRAPDALGDYVEDFGLALENLAWVDGAIFELRMQVVKKDDVTNTVQKNNKNLASPHDATLLLMSNRSLQLKSNETATVRLGFKNSGKTVWTNRGIKSLASVRIAEATNSPLTDWFSSEIPVSINDQPVKPGEIGFVDLPIRAPRAGGNYTLKLALVVDGELVNGGEFELPVEVIEEITPITSDTARMFVPFMDEPLIRIGLEKTQAPILITADRPYEVRTGTGTALGVVNAGIVSIVHFNFGTNIYSVETGTISYSGSDYVRFVPTAPETIFEIKSMTRNPYFSRTINDNMYRGALEIRLSEVGNLWIINELKIEDYLLGLAEVRDSAPLEFHKAQAIAARSFAYYNIANGGKYKKGYFDLTWTPDDQVYRGYGSEQRMPTIVRGTKETRGMFVQYDSKVVTTPYFAQSNGRTKTWSQVWGGKDKPWLQSVSAPADEGKPQRGHGVGMSQLDAIWRADQGANYEEILKYYYRGTEIKKLY